ncbi:hypothetical protein FKM82_025966 [Ascaphus truei]
MSRCRGKLQEPDFMFPQYHEILSGEGVPFGRSDSRLLQAHVVLLLTHITFVLGKFCCLNSAAGSLINRIVMLSEWVANLDGERYDLEGRVMVQRCANSVLKQEYDTLLGVRQESEEQLQKEVENQREMIEDLLKKKVLDAENQNQLNDRRKQDKLAREIKKALRKTLSIDVGFAPASCAASQEPSNVDISDTQECERPVTRASRSQSMMSLGSSKIVGAIKDIFE